MTIASALLYAYPELNEAQRVIVSHSEGPLLVIAGPESGKTFSLVLRATELRITQALCKIISNSNTFM